MNNNTPQDPTTPLSDHKIEIQPLHATVSPDETPVMAPKIDVNKIYPNPVVRDYDKEALQAVEEEENDIAARKAVRVVGFCIASAGPLLALTWIAIMILVFHVQISIEAAIPLAFYAAVISSPLLFLGFGVLKLSEKVRKSIVAFLWISILGIIVNVVTAPLLIGQISGAGSGAMCLFTMCGATQIGGVSIPHYAFYWYACYIIIGGIEFTLLRFFTKKNIKRQFS